MKFGRLLPGPLLALILLSLPGCGNRAQGGALNLNTSARRGKSIYDVQCAMCHDATNLHLIKEPPRLDGLFKKAALPSGAPATDAEVRNVILHGRGIMPPFEQSVNGDDLEALLAYLHTR